MTLLGVDVSSNDDGLSLASVRHLGYQFATARVLSYPHGLMTVDAQWARFRDEARALGMPFAGYVLFHTWYSPADQAGHVAAAIGDPRIPVMIDLEPDSDTPSLPFAAACWDALKAEGLRPVSLYDPHWYWTAQHGPDLRIRPWQLVSSNYGSNAPGGGLTRYGAEGGDQGPGWTSYGGLSPAIWQFGSQIAIGTLPDGTTRYGDADAYRGTLTQLAGSGLFTTWPAPTPPPPLEVDVQPIIAQEATTPPRYWVIAADLSSRVEVTADAFAALDRLPSYVNNPGLGQATLVRIPDVTVRPTPAPGPTP